MSGLPLGWSWAALGDLVPNRESITDGPFGSNLKTSHYTDSGPRVIRLQNIGDGEFIDARAHISQEHYEGLRKHAVEPGDVVVASLGTELPRSCIIPNTVGPAIVKADCIRVRLHDGVDVKYINYALNSPVVRSQATDLIHGVGRPRLGLKTIRTLQIPVPSLEEQCRIASAIDEQLSRIDSGTAILRTVPGRLDAVLARMTEALLAGSTAETVALADVLKRFVDCPHRTPKYSDDGAFPALRPRDVVRGVLNLDGAARVSSEEYKNQTERHAPRAGDIVYSRELSYGWAAVLPAGQEVCLSQGMVVMTPSDEMNSDFIAAYLNSAGGRRQVVKAAAGTAHPHVNLRDIRAFRVPQPSLPVQRELMTEVERLTSVIAVLRAEVERALFRSGVLRTAVLSQAFSGRLVPQESVTK